ncbi:Uncharacterised protein [Bordetella pertussis]|nr:Uncharacterised protein [Bordetella pertussis]
MPGAWRATSSSGMSDDPLMMAGMPAARAARASTMSPR